MNGQKKVKEAELNKSFPRKVLPKIACLIDESIHNILKTNLSMIGTSVV